MGRIEINPFGFNGILDKKWKKDHPDEPDEQVVDNSTYNQVRDQSTHQWTAPFGKTVFINRKRLVLIFDKNKRLERIFKLDQ